MNKQEYLERLQECLKHKLPREEIEDIMRDYAEYFEEGRRQSQQDSQIAAKLGDPELVAQQLIEESQEQAEEKKTSHVGVEKKAPWSQAWGYVSDKVKDAKEKFDQWDKGEGSQEAAPQEVEQPQKSEKAAHGPKQPKTEGVFLRFAKAIGKGCRWLVLAAIAAMIFCFVAALSMGVLTIWVGLLGVLLSALVVSAGMALVSCIGIILCGFAFVLVGKGAGGALLFGSVACIGLFSILSILFWRALRSCWKGSEPLFRWGLNVWSRMLHKFEGWLIEEGHHSKRKEKPAAKASPAQPSEKQVKLLPTALPSPLEEQGNAADANGKEGC